MSTQQKKPAISSADALEDDYVAGSDDDVASFAGSDGEQDFDEDESALVQGKKRKADSEPKPQQKKPKKGKKGDLKVDFESASPTDLSAWFTALLKQHSGVSALEASDIGLADEHFIDTSNFDGVRGLAGLSSYIDTCMEGGGERLKKPPAKRKSGRPVVIIVTSSGIRAAEIVRSLEEYREGCTIAKLFAKHFKLEEQATCSFSHSAATRSSSESHCRQ